MLVLVALVACSSKGALDTPNPPPDWPASNAAAGDAVATPPRPSAADTDAGTPDTPADAPPTAAPAAATNPPAPAAPAPTPAPTPTTPEKPKETP